jgi:ribosomal protein S27AE
MEIQRLAAVLNRAASWHIDCCTEESSCNLMTERDNMEAAVTNETNEVYDIHYENATFKAAVCHRCGAKMFPAELLEAHMDRHQLKDMFLESELKKLQYSMNRMR